MSSAQTGPVQDLEGINTQGETSPVSRPNNSAAKVRTRIMAVTILGREWAHPTLHPHRGEKNGEYPVQGQADSWSLSEGFNCGQLDGINRMKVGKQVFDPLRPTPGMSDEPRTLHALTPLLTVKTHSEPVRFIHPA